MYVCIYLNNIVPTLRWFIYVKLPHHSFRTSELCQAEIEFNLLISCQFTGLCFPLHVEVYIVFESPHHINHDNISTTSTINNIWKLLNIDLSLHLFIHICIMGYE